MESSPEDLKPESQEKPPKKAYATPELTVYDTVENTTGQKTYGSTDTSHSMPSPSDRDLKERFAAVDARGILARVATLPIRTWNYKGQPPSIRHIGPTAQDFAVAFGVGEGDRHIHPVDANGVALAAIQALYQLLQEKEAQIEALHTALEELKDRMLASATGSLA